MIKYDSKLGEFKIGLKYDHLAYALVGVDKGFSLPKDADKVVVSTLFANLIAKEEKRFKELLRIPKEVIQERNGEERTKRSRSRELHHRSSKERSGSHHHRHHKEKKRKDSSSKRSGSR